MVSRAAEYERRMRALGYQNSLDGMDDDDIEEALTRMDGGRVKEPEPQGFVRIRPGVDRDFAERMFRRFSRPFDPSWRMPDLDGPGYIMSTGPIVANRAGEGSGGGAQEPERKADFGVAKDGDGAGWSIDPFGMFPENLKGLSSTSGAPGGGTLDRYRSNEVVAGAGGPDGRGNVDGAQGASSSAGLKGYLDRLGDAESRGSGGYKARNEFGYLGKYQLGAAALVDAGFYNYGDGEEKGNVNNYNGTWTDKAKAYGVTSPEDFLNNPEAQEAAVMESTKRNWGYIRDRGYDKYIGKEIHGIKVTASGLLAACHLVGIGGVGELLEGNEIPADGYKTPATQYLENKGGFDLTEILGYNPDKN